MEGDRNTPAAGTPPSSGTPSTVAATAPDGKTYTQAEVDLIIARNSSKLDRQISALAKEKTALQSQLEANKAEVETSKELVATARKELEDMASDSPERSDYVKKFNALKDASAKLLVERKNLEAERLTHENAMKELRQSKWDKALAETTKRYQQADPERLKRVCQAAGITDVDAMEGIAATLWETDPTAKPAVTVHIDSGQTSGGGDNIGSLSPKERMAERDRRIRAGK